MGQFYDEIPERLFAFIRRSPLFFVATAPLQGGNVNVSPKSAAGAFELINKSRVRYVDYTGSGNETISHLLQAGNGRITIMFVNIESGPPNIIRIYGKGTVHERFIEGEESKFKEYLGGQQLAPGTRAVIDIAVHSCSTACGYSVPIYKYLGERKILTDWATKMETPVATSDAGKATMKKYNKELPTGKLFAGSNQPGQPIESWLQAYWVWNNAWSIDGLPGLQMSRPIADKEDGERLALKKKRHDDFEPPKESAGPFQPQVTTKMLSSAPQAPVGSQPIHLLLAFTLGCALTASLFLAPQVVTRLAI